KPTMVSTSVLSKAPANSGAVASAVVGRGGRGPTLTAGAAPAFGGSATPNHGPSFFAGAARGASSWADAETASESTTTAVARLLMAAILPAFVARAALARQAPTIRRNTPSNPIVD